MKKAQSLFILMLVVYCSIVFAGCSNSNNDARIEELERENEELKQQIKNLQNPPYTSFFSITNITKGTTTVEYTINKLKDKNIVRVQIISYKYNIDNPYSQTPMDTYGEWTVEHDMTSSAMGNFTYSIPSQTQSVRVKVIYAA